MTLHQAVPPITRAISDRGGRRSILQARSESPAAGFAPLGRSRPGARERMVDAARVEALATTEPAAEADPGSLIALWHRLAGLGRRDLVLARLVEGHVDARHILAEAGRPAVPHAVYGVWASSSGRTGLRVEPSASDGLAGWRVSGTMRFCTGASWIDRALVTARAEDGQLLLLDVDVRASDWTPVPGSWPAVGMDLSESLDLEVDAWVPGTALVSAGGFYLDRPGFWLGGIGVAAVWLGGAAGVLDVIVDGLRLGQPDPHQLAHLGAMTAAVRAADALLGDIACAADDLDLDELPRQALLARAVVDAAVATVLERGPRVTGPTPLCRDGDFAHRVSDLQVYVRQQHAERDLAELGRAVLASW